MTNIIAALIVTVGTNWASIGEFKDKAGIAFDVQQACYITNHTLIFEEDNKKYEWIYKSYEGPVILERKERKFIPNIVWFDYSSTNIYTTNFGRLKTNDTLW